MLVFQNYVCVGMTRFVAQLPSCYVFAFNYITSLILCEPKIETTVLETLDLEDVKKLMSHEYLNSDLSCLGIRTLVSP